MTTKASTAHPATQSSAGDPSGLTAGIQETATTRRGMAGAPRWRPKSSTLRVRVVLYFLGLDLACIVFGFAAAALIRGVVISDPNWLIVVALALPLYVLSALNAHAFSTDKLESPHRAVASAVRSLFIALALVLLMAFALKASADVSRLTFAIGSLISVVTLGVARHQFVDRKSVV